MRLALLALLSVVLMVASTWGDTLPRASWPLALIAPQTHDPSGPKNPAPQGFAKTFVLNRLAAR
jgi:hypothetical protein